MYARLTSLPYPPGSRRDVHQFWTSERAGVIGEQDGFRASIVLDAACSDDLRCVAITIWDDAESFEQFYSGDHISINAPLAATGMKVATRQALEVVAVTLPQPGEVRVIRLLIDPTEFDRVLEFWRIKGQQLVEQQPGNLGAWALRDGFSTELTLMFAWRSPADGEAFLQSEIHREEFAPGLGSKTQRLDLRRLIVV